VWSGIGVMILAMISGFGCCFLICFFFALRRETRKHQTVVHQWRALMTVQHSGPRHLAPVIELKHGVLHGSDEDEIRQVVGRASAVR
jgi:hypothetical protein